MTNKYINLFEVYSFSIKNNLLITLTNVFKASVNKFGNSVFQRVSKM